MKSFYTNAAVRQRLVEFLGSEELEHATAVYLTHTDGCAFDRRELRPPSELTSMMIRDRDMARSLSDTASFLLHLDVEYVNFDAPAEAYLDPWRAFELQEPVVKAIETLLLGWGIRPLHLLTGQGHHFVWRITRESPVAQQLLNLAPAPELLDESLQRVPPILRGRLDADSQRAFAASSLLMEYVAHRVKSVAVPAAQLPVEITAVHVGPVPRSGKREIVSIDISEYGDPVHTRMVRMPFTNYLKPWLSGLARTLGLEAEIPAVRVVPLHEMNVPLALKVRQVDAEVAEIAGRACVRIPEQSHGTGRLLDEYLASRLRCFHDFFYSTQHDPAERWIHTYAQAPLQHLPSCVRHLIEHPNDRLLKPAGMQLVARGLLAAGWHPRHIGGLIRSIFANAMHGWGVNWQDYEPATRADFYVRLFSGLYETGIDRLLDFNCVSTREKGFCLSPPDAGSCLVPLQQKLLSQQCR